jgi:hypothetical protein
MDTVTLKAAMVSEINYLIKKKQLILGYLG